MLTVYSWNHDVEFMNLETVSKEHALKELNDEKLTDFTNIKFNKSVKKVESGVIELFSNIRTLIFQKDIECIEESPELDNLLKKNNVIIRGYYDTCIEELANKLHLRFIQADILLGSHDDEEHCVTSSWELCFKDDGTPYLEHSDSYYSRDSGSLGGSIRHEIEKDFYIDCTTEKFAERFGDFYTNQIRENENLKMYLASMNARLNK